LMEATAYPKLPGLTPGHDPTRVVHHRVSAKKQESNRDYANRPVPKYNLPRRQQPTGPEQTKAFTMLSTSQSVYGAWQEDVTETFEPVFVTLDK